MTTTTTATTWTEVQVLPGRGRGLVATRDIAAGQCIALHEPLVTAVSPAWQSHVCQHCFASAYPRKWPLTCSGSDCQLRSCSSTCQEASCHKPDSAPCRARRRLHQQLLKDGKADTVAWTSVAAALVLEALLSPPEVWTLLMKLCSLTHEDVENELMQEMVGIANVAIACLENDDDSAARQKDGMDLLLRSECNAFSYWSDDGAQDQLGMGLFLDAAMFNHACCPNVGKVLDGRRLRFVALRRIAAGEELSISYVPLDEDGTSRRAILQKHFHFVCVCARCSGEVDEGKYLDEYVHKSCGGSWVPQEEGDGGGGGNKYCSLCKQTQK